MPSTRGSLEERDKRVRKEAESGGWLPLYEALEDLMAEFRSGKFSSEEDYNEALESVIQEFIQDSSGSDNKSSVG